jgi:hypothetical protein
VQGNDQKSAKAGSLVDKKERMKVVMASEEKPLTTNMIFHNFVDIYM